MNDDIFKSFSSLCEDTAKSGVLRRLTLSKPAFDSAATKITCSCYRTDGRIFVKTEALQPDGKCIRKNISADEFADYVSRLAPIYGQGDLMTNTRKAGYVTSKKGKITYSGEKSVREALKNESEVSIPNGADRRKRYIFDGSEEFLHLLGISDENGRVHDKKQSKFRQINRFTELLDDVYEKLPESGTLRVCDLCCGKSYLSFAVYHYLHTIRSRDVKMLCVDRKKDVIEYCAGIAGAVGFDGLSFVCSDIGNDRLYTEAFGDNKVDLTVSLHACDIATDIVLRRAVSMRSEVILSTPCCHHELNGKIKSPELDFICSHSMLSQKLTDAVTDALRVKMLEVEGYSVGTVELIDPEETPKNVLIRAIRKKKSADSDKLRCEYNAIIDFLGIKGGYYDIYGEK